MKIVAMPLFVSMHFRFKMYNREFYNANGEWVFISAVFVLSTHLTPKVLSLFISYYITPPEYAAHFLNNTQKQNFFPA